MYNFILDPVFRSRVAGWAWSYLFYLSLCLVFVGFTGRWLVVASVSLKNSPLWFLPGCQLFGCVCLLSAQCFWHSLWQINRRFPVICTVSSYYTGLKWCSGRWKAAWLLTNIWHLDLWWVEGSSRRRNSLLQCGVSWFAALKAFDLLIFIGVSCSFKEATGSKQRVKRGEGSVDFHTADAKWQTGHKEVKEVFHSVNLLACRPMPTCREPVRSNICLATLDNKIKRKLFYTGLKASLLCGRPGIFCNIVSVTFTAATRRRQTLKL